jgi:alkanesulfonate monooxygenase SsuD/methylene tetrahydromethanopterin reductase-like flavin-dependent oxidoreductase (luciferase family)
VLSAGSTRAEIRDRVQVYRQALREAGKDPAAARPLVVNRVTHVVGSRAEKRRAEELFAERFLSFYDRWGHADVARLDSRERVYEETSREHFIVGEASECTERIHEYAEMGVGHVACLMNFGKPDRELVDRSLDRFGEDVLPHCAGR